MEEQSIYYERFPLLIFDNKTHKRNHLNVQNLPEQFYGYSIKTSPIAMNSALYDEEKYNIQMLKNVLFDNKPVSLTVIELPKLKFRAADVLNNTVKFCAITNTRNNILQLVEYKTLKLTPVKKLDDDAEDELETGGSTQCVVNIPSNSNNKYSLNRNQFVIISYNNNTLNMTQTSIVYSWQWKKRNIKNNAALVSKTPEPEPQPAAKKQKLTIVANSAPVFLFPIGEEFIGRGYVKRTPLTDEEEDFLQIMQQSEAAMVAAINLFLIIKYDGEDEDEARDCISDLKKLKVDISDDMVKQLALTIDSWEDTDYMESNKAANKNQCPRVYMFMNYDW